MRRPPLLALLSLLGLAVAPEPMSDIDPRIRQGGRTWHLGQARQASNLAERDHLTRQAARLNAR